MELLSTSSLLEAHLASFLSFVFQLSLLLLLQPNTLVCFDHFVSADLLFVLLLSFNSGQINGHRLVKPSESVVVGAAVTGFPCGN